VPKTLLAVDDSATMRKVLEITFSGEDFRVVTADGASTALSRMGGEQPVAAVIDTSLGSDDGYALAKEMRSRDSRLALVILASRYSPYDANRGRDAGVDDYITKPFSLRELLARIRAVMRRCAPQLGDDVIEIAGLKLESVVHRVSCAGHDIELGDIEFRMLHFFMTHAERVYSRAQLLDEVWGDRVFVEERTVDVHIRRLRQALAPTGHDRLIETVRGTGYRFRRNPA